MSKVRTILLAAVTVVAFSAIAVSSATASPEFIKTAGVYPIKFTGAPTNAVTLPPTLESSLGTVKCTNDSSSGEITKDGMESTKIAVTFTGCTLGTSNCTTSGQAAGTIVANPLMGLLGTASGAVAKNVTGLLLALTSNTLEPGPLTSTGAFASFTCGIVPVTVTGKGVIGRITPLGAKSKTFKLTFSTEAGPKQELNELTLLTGTKETSVSLIVGGKEAGQMSEDTLTLLAGAEGEIK